MNIKVDVFTVREKSRNVSVGAGLRSAVLAGYLYMLYQDISMVFKMLLCLSLPNFPSGFAVWR